MNWWEYANNRFKFADEMVKESNRAERKFPDGKHLFTALVEEVGEVAEALLKIQGSGESPQNVYDGCVRVASTAMRLATLGGKEYSYEGTKCHHTGCTQPVVGGPCALCYE